MTMAMQLNALCELKLTNPLEVIVCLLTWIVVVLLLSANAGDVTVANVPITTAAAASTAVIAKIVVLFINEH